MLKGNCDHQLEGGRLVIRAYPKEDYFVSPTDGSVAAGAAFLYEEVTGDFVCRAKISLEHKYMFDAGVLLALADDTHWAKACFEMGDYGFKSVCTIMTDGASDDCNCATIEGSSVWLQLARTGDVFSVHYSADGENYYMARLCRLRLDKTLKVGFSAQSPTGDGAEVTFSDFSIEKRSLGNPRLGK